MAPNIKVLIIVFTMFVWFLACVIALFLEVYNIVSQGTTTSVFIFFLIVVLVEFFFLFILPLIIR